ncbi:hypothetical protein AAGW05_13795 [Arthrobacter sp. LAPM80]|uniref:hypothetical protein n=1 Tax=Arthrobacter sp. LAPM80 TaxID=3141788 RepID=UPI00398B72F2
MAVKQSRGSPFFDLPRDIGPHHFGAEVTQLGRRDGFPRLSNAKHRSTHQGGAIRLMQPEASEGDSGGPVVDSNGNLLGISYNTSNSFPDTAMLLSAESIVAVASSVNGVTVEWPGTEIPASTI